MCIDCKVITFKKLNKITTLNTLYSLNYLYPHSLQRTNDRLQRQHAALKSELAELIAAQASGNPPVATQNGYIPYEASPTKPLESLDNSRLSSFDEQVISSLYVCIPFVV